MPGGGEAEIEIELVPEGFHNSIAIGTADCGLDAASSADRVDFAQGGVDGDGDHARTPSGPVRPGGGVATPRGCETAENAARNPWTPMSLQSPSIAKQFSDTIASIRMSIGSTPTIDVGGSRRESSGWPVSAPELAVPCDARPSRPNFENRGFARRFRWDSQGAS